jgi:hypothetical protein
VGRVFIGLVWWDTQGSSNLLLRTRIQGLDPRERERERGAQTLDLKESFAFLSGQQLKGVGGGLFIVPTSKRAIEESFTRLVQCCSLEVSLDWTCLVHRTSPVRTGQV